MEIKGKPYKTKWGLAIDLNGECVFINYSCHYKEIKLDHEYDFKLVYHILYPTTPDKANKNWEYIRGNSKEEIIKNPTFIKFNLLPDNIQTRVEIINMGH